MTFHLVLVSSSSVCCNAKMNRPFPPTLRKGLPATGYNPRVGRAGKPAFAGRPQQEDIAPIYLYLSLIPIFILVGVGLAGLGLTRLRKRNEERKLKVLKNYGWSGKEEEVKQSEDEPIDSGLRNRKRGAVVTTSKTLSEKPLIVGFWHPYWYVSSFLYPFFADRMTNAATQAEEENESSGRQSPGSKRRTQTVEFSQSYTLGTTLKPQKKRSSIRSRYVFSHHPVTTAYNLPSRHDSISPSIRLPSTSYR
jgi:hypothetical protein